MVRRWVVSPPVCTTGLSLIARGCLIGATPWTSAVTFPHGGNGLNARQMAVLSTFREPALCRHVHRELLRSALPDLTPIISATACHQRNYVARYSRFIIERLNLDLRQRVAAIGRRVNTLCQGEDGLQHQLALFHVYHNFVLPHTSLRQPLQVPEPTHGSGSAKVWQPCTPAMAAGLTDHVWTLKEVLFYRVPPWPQPAGV